ncbi:MAG: hypothetical protein Q9184_003206 [Pyrenodesmia sp. 2 TL-2023]
MYLGAQILIWVNVVFYFLQTFLLIFAFSPRRKAWDPPVVGGRGIDAFALSTAAGMVNAVSDLGALILPQLSVWRLQMTRKKKIQISAVFLVGAFACAASITRLGYAIKRYMSKDKAYYVWIEALCAPAEMASGVIVACVPVSPKFFRTLQQTQIFKALAFSIQALLRSSKPDKPRANGGASLPHHVTLKMLSPSRGLGWPKMYEEFDNGGLFEGDVARHQTSSGLITRSIDIRVTEEPASEAQLQDLNAQGRVWQGNYSYGNSRAV